MLPSIDLVCFFFFNDTATTEIYTLSLHDALPIWRATGSQRSSTVCRAWGRTSRPCPTVSSSEARPACGARRSKRSEEHTSELQSRLHLVCRLLLEKKKSCAHDTALAHLRTCPYSL